MATQWFFKDNGKKSKPQTSRQLKQLAEDGRIQPTTPVWREGLGEWVEARRVRGLFSDTGESAAALSGIQKSHAPAADNRVPSRNESSAARVVTHAASSSALPTAEALSASTSPPPLPDGRAVEASEKVASANRLSALGATVTHWIKRAVQELVMTCALLAAHLITLVQYAAGLWKRRSLNKESLAARLRLGEAMFRHELGAEEVRRKIAGLDNQIANVTADGGAVKALQAERRGLLVRLASEGRGYQVVQDDYARLVVIETTCDRVREGRLQQRKRLWPARWSDRLRVTAGYLFIGVFGVTLFGLMSSFTPNGNGESLELAYENSVQAFYSCNYEEARRGFLEVAGKGHPKAQFFLGVMAKDGLGIPADGKAAADWFERAHPELIRLADQNDPVALAQLAQMYDKYEVTPPSSDRSAHAEARRLYVQAVPGLIILAEQGNSFAQFRLGHIYLARLRVNDDATESVRWWRKAAEQGNAWAMVGLAEHHAKDDAESIRWYRQAAEFGHADAMINLGASYMRGEGVAEDKPEGIRWFHRAADAGSVEAMYRLGVGYADGEGVAEDAKQAYRWMHQAATGGHDGAALRLGGMYATGTGVGKNLDQAVHWVRTAADNGDTVAIDALPALLLLNSGYFETGVLSPETATEFYDRLRRAARGRRDKSTDNRGLFKWHVLPVIPGEWSLVKDARQQQQFAGQLNRALQEKRYATAKVFLDNVRSIQLSCYDDARLYEAADNNGGAYAIIVAGEETLLFTGNEQLHDFNARHTPRLDREDRVAEYLCLFNRGIQAPNGTFIVAYAPYMIPWHWKLSEPAIEKYLERFRPLRGERQADGTWNFEATVCYGTGVLESTYRVHSDGRVEMLQDNPIAERLPLFVEKYENGRRVFIDLSETPGTNGADSEARGDERSSASNVEKDPGTGSSKSGSQKKSSKSLAPLQEPVQESPGRPAHLPESNMASLKSQSIKVLEQYATRRFGRFENWAIVEHYEACLDLATPIPPEIYIELGMAYLTFGRFDSAIAILEKAKKEVSSGNSNAQFIDLVLAEANKVKAMLTQARDALRRDGVDVTYPNEVIFTKAFSTLAPNDDFLALNLADAYATEFPNSLNALRTLAEFNLGYFESPPNGTSVPRIRGQAVISRGQSALEKLATLDEENLYPATRLMQHILLTADRVNRSQLPALVIDVIRDLDDDSRMTKSQQAFFYYARAMYFLKGPSWETPIADKLITWLEAAVRLDPESDEYKTALAVVRTNKEEINRMKLQANAREAARSRELAQKMFQRSPTQTRDRGEEIVGAIISVFGI